MVHTIRLTPHQSIQKKEGKKKISPSSAPSSFDIAPTTTPQPSAVSVSGMHSVTLQDMEGILNMASDDHNNTTSKGIRHGHTMLDGLEHIKNKILFGNLSSADLNSLKKLIHETPSFPHDSHLNAIMHEIKVRIDVECAKLEAK